MKDQTERDLIETDLLSNMLVEASAGSGKTHSLAGRIVNGIGSGAYRVEHIAAVTFTRKAAAELSMRIRLGLEAAGATEALARFEELFVGTVHSFCSGILRNFPLQAGVSPGFHELEPAEDRRLRRQLLREACDQPRGRVLLRLLAEFEAAATELWAPLDLMSDNGDLEYPATPTSLPDLTEVWSRVDEFWEQWGGQIPESEEREPTCKIIQAGRAFARQVELGARDRLRDAIRCLIPWEAKPAPVKKYWGVKRDEQSRRVEAFLLGLDEFRQNLVLPTLAGWRAHLYGECIPFLAEVRRRSQEERRQRGVLNFNDLLRHTLTLLQSEEAIRDRLRDKIRHLFVDEFQDTDPVQAEIFALLAGPTPRPGSLFLVGDPKQSIYRFRRADVQTYNGVREHILASGGRVVRLPSSFRSQAPLCEWLNQAFSKLLPEDPSPRQAAYSPLVAVREDHSEPAVYALTTGSGRYGEVAREEAQRIADYLESQGQGRWGDYLILTARNADVQLYQQAMESRGIPCEATREETALSSRGASFLPLLRHLADPQDNANLVGVLRGPLFGHSDPELFLHVRAAGTLRPYPPGAGLPSVAASLAKLDEWRLKVRFEPLGAAVAYLLEETGLMAVAASEEPESLAELRGILHFMRRAGEMGLTLAQAVADLVERNAVERPSRTCGQKNAVRVMNVHKAKGLEARVVFLAAPTSGFSLATDHVVTPRREGFLCIRRFRKPLAHPPDWDDLEAAELEYLRAEHRRFLYVAATRARDTLVVGQWSGSHGSVQRPWGDLDLSGVPELTFPSAEAGSPEQAFTSPEEFARLREGRGARRQPSWTRGSIAVGKGGPRLAPTLPPDHLQIDARDWGHLIHKLLEYLVRDPEMDSEQLRRLGNWLAFESPELMEAVPYALETLEEIKRSVLWEWVQSSDTRLVEVPFGVGRARRLLFGTIDVALQRGDGWGVIDYKTDRQNLEVLVASYAGQIAKYAESWEGVTEDPVRYAGLFGVREGRLSADLHGV